jgi:hypothetical protein
MCAAADAELMFVNAVASGGYNLLGINAGCTGFTNGVNGDQVGTSGEERRSHRFFVRTARVIHVICGVPFAYGFKQA